MKKASKTAAKKASTPSAKYVIDRERMDKALELARKRSDRIRRSAVVDSNVLNQPFTI